MVFLLYFSQSSAVVKLSQNLAFYSAARTWKNEENSMIRQQVSGGVVESTDKICLLTHDFKKWNDWSIPHPHTTYIQGRYEGSRHLPKLNFINEGEGRTFSLSDYIQEHNWGVLFVIGLHLTEGNQLHCNVSTCPPIFYFLTDEPFYEITWTFYWILLLV